MMAGTEIIVGGRAASGLENITTPSLLVDFMMAGTEIIVGGGAASDLEIPPHLPYWLISLWWALR